MSPKRKERRIIKADSLTCKPLDSYSEILLFLENPPPWRSLCKGMTPHSDRLIRNMEINKNIAYFAYDTPEYFCHFDPDKEDPKRYDAKYLRKTLVCHDMANGYHDDSIIDGTANYDGYTFYNWAGIDIFCYFSHHLITIPPVGWINMGHAHGVKVIGTVITEWAEGITFWDQVLVSETEYQNLASALVAIAKMLKFDGWLLNIENKISKPNMLLEFVRYLHKVLHEELENAVLMWYDSVTVQGNLNWQNGLNEKNKAFFDVCDGFFTNYSWSVDDVVSSVAEADERVTDLFIGIDVWGRNFFGGGQFNTQEAIKVAHHAGCSLAIFAPAWTQEALSTESNDPNSVAMADNLDAYGQFLLRDRAFWGTVLCPSPWYNLRHQQYQPNAAHGPHGYQLSSTDRTIRGSRTSHFKDKKGIIKYHSSLHIIRHHYPAGTRDSRRLSDDSITSLREEDDTTTTDSANTKSDETGGDDSQKKIGKRMKMKIAFKNLFRQKARKLSDDDSRSSKSSSQEMKEGSKSEKRKSEEHKSENKNEENRNQECKREEYTNQEGKIDEGHNQESKIEESQNQEGKTEEVQNQESKIEESQNQESKIEESQNQEGKIEDGRNEEPKREMKQLMSVSMAGPSSSTVTTPRVRSMLQMSVNLRLGTSAEKTRFTLAHVPEERECLELHLDDSFIGGACLRVNPSDKLSSEHRFTRLFYCDFKCEDTLVFCIVTKTMKHYKEQTLNVVLFMKNAKEEDLTIVLTGRDAAQVTRLDKSASGVNYVYPLNTSSDEVFRDLRTYLLLNEPSFYVPIENCYDWTVRYYQVSVPGSCITSINLRTGLPHGGILLGYLGICSRYQKPGTKF